jgi:DNA helicase-2/ATP-dependent DNA helicase PcrA
LRLRLRALLDDLRMGHVAPEQIVVLTPCAEEATQLSWWEEDLGLSHTPQDGLILWDTVYRFKGLERPIVILVELDQAAIAHTVIDQLLYVAYSRASNRLFVLHSNEVNQETIRRLEGMARPVPASITDALDPYQFSAVQAELGRVLVWAGAGSGKTRVLTRRIAYLLSHYEIPAEQIMAVTFTNKAAKEMKDRLTQLLGAEMTSALTVGTFHAICARLLRAEIPRLSGEQHYGRGANFRVLDDDEARAYLIAAIGSLQLEPTQLKVFISKQKNNGYAPYQCTAETSLDELKINAYMAYEDLLAHDNRVDFDDLLLLTARLLEEHESVRSRLSRRYRHITVDEFQDTNTTQFRIVQLLAQPQEGQDDGPGSLMVVGDAQQAIYSWRQARYTLFTEFAQHFPDVSIHRLHMNYRSTRRIIEVALVVADPQFTGVDRLDMYPDRKDAALDVVALEFDDAEAEAREIAKRIRMVLDTNTYEPRDIVVLLRALKGSTNATETVRQLEIAFRLARIPSVTQGVQSFYRNPIIQSLVIWLRALYNPEDDAALKAALDTKLASNIGQKTIAHLDTVWQQLGKGCLWELLSARAEDVLGEQRWTFDSLLASAIGHGRVDTLATLVTQIQQLRARRPARPPFGDFLQAFRAVTQFDTFYRTDENDEEFSALMIIFQQVLDAEVSETQDLLCVLDMFALYDRAIDESELSEQGKVRIMSIHRAKGLEFPMVFVPALEEGSLPSERSYDDGEALLEEGRICYVALTRAQDELILSTTRRRGADRSTTVHPSLQPSRYFRAVQEIVEARQALAKLEDGMAIGDPPNYDPYVDVEQYRAEPEVVVVDTTQTALDQATWYRLGRALCAVPGAYPVQIVLCDEDGHIVTQEMGCVCGAEHVLRWLRQMTHLPVVRFRA